ncbi:PIN domain-containing protein [Geodermatophilus sp. CPCC 206100]|uniref:PIN domain-containing protein n=1 Tax=Geodermatophilus sp. CPCC 206100 TaxID=3020054 RepID=UPI003B00045A
MIVFLDANILMQDPMCTGVVWQVLAHAPESWSLKLVTSEIAVAEAVAGYERSVVGILDGLEKMTRSWGRIGAQSEADVLRESMQRRIDDYRTHLTDSLTAAGVKVLGAPSVPHMDVVARSVTRRRPCDDKGDGYRDTLVWLTALALAVDNPDEKLILVTSDSDFMDDEKMGFHAHLLEDLSGISAEERVSLTSVLGDVVLELAERSADDADLRDLRGELKDETVRLYMASLLDGVLHAPLDADACALPHGAASNFLRSVGPIRSIEYTIRGGVGQDEAVAEFSFVADGEIVLSTPEGVDLAEDAHMRRVLGSSGGVYLLTKPLIFVGIMQLERYDRPIGGEISRISAAPDEPVETTEEPDRPVNRPEAQSLGGGVVRGVNVTPSTDYLANLSFAPPTDYLKNIRFTPATDYLNVNVTPSTDYLKNIRFTPTTDYLKNIRFTPTTDYLKNIRFTPTDYLNINVTPSTDYLKNIRFTPSTDYLKNIRFTPTTDYLNINVGPSTDSGADLDPQGDENLTPDQDPELDSGPQDEPRDD